MLDWLLGNKRQVFDLNDREIFWAALGLFMRRYSTVSTAEEGFHIFQTLREEVIRGKEENRQAGTAWNNQGL